MQTSIAADTLRNLQYPRMSHADEFNARVVDYLVSKELVHTRDKMPRMLWLTKILSSRDTIEDAESYVQTNLGYCVGLTKRGRAVVEGINASNFDYSPNYKPPLSEVDFDLLLDRWEHIRGTDWVVISEAAKQLSVPVDAKYLDVFASLAKATVSEKERLGFSDFLSPFCRRYDSHRGFCNNNISNYGICESAVSALASAYRETVASGDFGILWAVRDAGAPPDFLDIGEGDLVNKYAWDAYERELVLIEQYELMWGGPQTRPDAPTAKRARLCAKIVPAKRA